MSIRSRIDDGTYWVVEGQPVMFDPPAQSMERVLMHYPDAAVDKCKRLSGSQWLDLVGLLEQRARPNQTQDALAEAIRERVAIQTEGRDVRS